MIYGYDGTIHSTTHLHVETNKGKVVAVWFRCMPIPFEQCPVDPERAAEMERMYVETSVRKLVAVDVQGADGK